MSPPIAELLLSIERTSIFWIIAGTWVQNELCGVNVISCWLGYAMTFGMIYYHGCLAGRGFGSMHCATWCACCVGSCWQLFKGICQALTLAMFPPFCGLVQLLL